MQRCGRSAGFRAAPAACRYPCVCRTRLLMDHRRPASTHRIDARRAAAPGAHAAARAAPRRSDQFEKVARVVPARRTSRSTCPARSRTLTARRCAAIRCIRICRLRASGARWRTPATKSARPISVRRPSSRITRTSPVGREPAPRVAVEPGGARQWQQFLEQYRDDLADDALDATASPPVSSSTAPPISLRSSRATG